MCINVSRKQDVALITTPEKPYCSDNFSLDCEVTLKGDSMETFDHVVVGGGAMGAATAWQLASRGHSVALIEQFGIAQNHA